MVAVEVDVRVADVDQLEKIMIIAVRMVIHYLGDSQATDEIRLVAGQPVGSAGGRNGKEVDLAAAVNNATFGDLRGLRLEQKLVECVSFPIDDGDELTVNLQSETKLIGTVVRIAIGDE